MNTPGGNTVSTAQLAMSLLCSLARHIPAANMSIKAVSLLFTCATYTVILTCENTICQMHVLLAYANN
jgi:lactate dehydrogenase-like 2-hydroxyacid dehydrogenase